MSLLVSASRHGTIAALGLAGVAPVIIDVAAVPGLWQVITQGLRTQGGGEEAHKVLLPKPGCTGLRVASHAVRQGERNPFTLEPLLCSPACVQNMCAAVACEFPPAACLQATADHEVTVGCATIDGQCVIATDLMPQSAWTSMDCTHMIGSLICERGLTCLWKQMLSFSRL